MIDNLREKNPAPESPEDQKYREFQLAMDEEDRVMAEINKVIAETSNRVEAEKIVLEELAPLMDKAIKKSGEALRSWLDAMRKNHESEN